MPDKKERKTVLTFLHLEKEMCIVCKMSCNIKQENIYHRNEKYNK